MTTRAQAQTQRAPIGREEELAAIGSFLSEAGSRRALLLEGTPGVGKTTLWQAAVDAARSGGFRVLVARPSSAEASLSFAALTDLLEEVDTAELPGLPGPQRHALDVALLRAPARRPVEARAVATALLTALRELASREHVAVAIDDVQWLDRPSADALAFASRRLAGAEVVFLVAQRAGATTPLAAALSRSGLERLTIAPLSLGAIQLLLLTRLGLSLPRRVLRQIYASSQGNPLFAIELGRAVSEHALPAIGEALPVPDAVEDLLGVRIGALDPPLRRLLLGLALAGELRVDEVAALAGDVLEAAVAGDVAVVEADRVRPFHPLLAETALARAPAEERRSVHAGLAAVLPDEALRLRHLALAAAAPDDGLAWRLAEAAVAAAARGGAEEAVLLADQALRLTPPGSPERPSRVVWLGHYLAVVGERERVTELLSREIDDLPAGALRAHAWLMMPGGVVHDNDEVRRYLERALEESRDSPPLRAAVLGNLTTNAVTIRVERLAEAGAWAEEGLEILAGADPEIERSLLYALACARAMAGLPTEKLVERFAALPPGPFYLLATPARLHGCRLMWRGEIESARAVFQELLSLAEERGESGSYAAVRCHLCELELRRGDWQAVRRLLGEWTDPVEREIIPWPAYERCQALLAGGLGHADEARRWSEETVRLARATGVRFEELGGLHAQGLAALLAHDARAAAEALGGVWDHLEREGVEEPGVFPVAPDLVEALVELGEADGAHAVTERLASLARAQDHPWRRASADRCSAVLALAAGDHDAAARLAAAAAERYAELDLEFDRARTLLALGRGQRRLKKWGASRRSLDAAVFAFDELGATGWAERCRSELGRVGGRAGAATGELTPAELRVVQLAAEGMANKEIAAALFISVNTVEVHLKRAYAKLGVRSRAQLAGRLRRP